MGASLDTPAAVCPLCNSAYRDPITLKCKHRFCQRCIGDLWSDSLNGPYYCPEWRCKTEYKTLPFQRNATPTSASGQRAHPRSTAGQSAGWTAGKSSLTSRLLGKRKASTPAPEQEPDSKRAAPVSGSHVSSEIPTPSLLVQPGGSSAMETEERPESLRSSSSSSSSSSNGLPPPLQTDGDIILSSDSSSSGNSDVTLTSATPPVLGERDTSRSKEVPLPDESEEGEEAAALLLDESDGGSSEVDTCDGPAPATQRKDTPVKETGKPVSVSASAPNHSAGVSPAGKERSPSQRAGWPPPVFTKRPVAATTTASPPKRITLSPRPESTAGAGPLPCHYCPSPGQQSAVKTCLVCGASMCPEHLRPHLDSPVFQNHTLVPPTEDISPWRCQEHQEMNRIYCRQCAACVCTVCTVIGSHRDHACISIREAERELRANLKEEIKQLQETEQSLINRVAELTQKKQTFTVVLGEARAGVRQQYMAMREALEQEEQTALQCVTQEEGKAVGGVEDQLRQLQDSLTSVQHGLHSLEGLADAKGDKRVQDQVFLLEYSKTTQMVGDMGKSVEVLEPIEDVDRARLNCLQKWTEKRLDTVVISLPERDPYKLLYGTIPSLDADTAHPKLVLSEDNRRVAYSEAQQAYPEHGARFSSFPQVLASRALEGGRWYWEVEGPLGEGRWKVGLCEDDIGRKGQKDSCRLGFNPHSWCLGGEKGKVEALHDKVAVPVATESLKKVGMFLDFDQGILSFYNVAPGGSLALLHCFRHSFTEPLYPALSVSKTHLAFCDLFQTPSAK